MRFPTACLSIYEDRAIYSTKEFTYERDHNFIKSRVLGVLCSNNRSKRTVVLSLNLDVRVVRLLDPAFRPLTTRLDSNGAGQTEFCTSFLLCCG
jgi:hypothetical protein